MSENPFWQFALELYKQPGVESACLAFQDQYHGNVNLLLFCCWIDHQKCTLTVSQFDELVSRVRDWEEQYLGELRRLRRGCQVQLGESERQHRLYDLAKRLELAGERRVCDWLFQWYANAKPDVQSDTSMAGDYVEMFTSYPGPVAPVIHASKSLHGTISGSG